MCEICDDGNRDLIEAEILNQGTAYTTISEAYGFEIEVIKEHMENHVGRSVGDQQFEDFFDGDDQFRLVLTKLQGLDALANEVLKTRAEELSIDMVRQITSLNKEFRLMLNTWMDLEEKRQERMSDYKMRFETLKDIVLSELDDESQQQVLMKLEED